MGYNYICDYYNTLIQILSEEFSFKSQFDKDTLKQPTLLNRTLRAAHEIPN